MKKNSLRFLTFIFMGIIFYSCQNEIEETSETELTLSEELTSKTDGQIILGKKLKNPYSVVNMRKAYDNLKNSSTYANKSENELEIETTHLYVKFTPKNENELLLLKKDSTLVLYPYPLDFEIEEEGDFYRSPEIPQGQPTYQYCAVKVGKKLPSGVKSEILEELFIPDEEKDNDNLKSKLNQVTDVLVDEALRITNNIDEEDKKSTLYYRRSKWRPSGIITMQDDTLGNIGIEGLKVRARRWFTTHIGFTDADGKFSCDGRFRGKARYKLDWERYHFALRDGGFSSAQKTGPRGRKKSWEWHITDGEHKYFATIFRAAYHYYYQDIQGLRRPPLNSFWSTQLRIGAFTQDKGYIGVHSNIWRAFGVSTPVKIYLYSGGSDEIYANTIHELAHASHWNMDRSVFNDTDDKIKESWARGVEWVLTRMNYPNHLGQVYRSDDYTLIVSDMIDGEETLSTRTNEGTRGFNDKVEGYTIKQIEDALYKQKSWNSWRDNIIDKFDNLTEDNLKLLFKIYE